MATAAVTRSSEATASTVVITSADFMGTAAISTTMVITTEVTSGTSGALDLTIITGETPTIRADSRFSSAAAILTAGSQSAL